MLAHYRQNVGSNIRWYHSVNVNQTFQKYDNYCLWERPFYAWAASDQNFIDHEADFIVDNCGHAPVLRSRLGSERDDQSQEFLAGKSFP